MTNKIEFTNKQLVRLIWPLVIEQFLSLAVGLADSIMVAQVGDAAVSGVSLVDSVVVLMMYIFSAVAAGGAAVCGQYIGRQAYTESRSAGQHLYGLLIAFSAFLTLLLYIFKGPIVGGLFGKIEPDVMAATNTYYTIVMASVPAIALYNAGTALFRAMGMTRITLRISMLMNAINVGGNALLIFGFGFGVEGVAIPTLVSRWAAAAVVTLLLFRKKYMLNLADVRSFSFNRRILGNIVRIGIPGGVENGMFQLGKIILYSFISTMGTAAITANAVGGTLSVLNVLMGMSINLAMTTVVSQCIGAGDFDKARYYFRKLIIWAYVLTAVWVAFLLAVLPFILKIYNIDPEASRMAHDIEWLHGICTVLIWIPSFTTPTFLRSAGDSTYTMIVSVCSMWIGRVLGGYILATYFGLGLMGVWIAHAIVDWTVRSIFFTVRYKSNKWESKAIK